MNSWVAPLIVIMVVGIAVGVISLMGIPLGQATTIGPNIQAPANVLALTEKIADESIRLADIGTPSVTDDFTSDDKLIITNNATQIDENGILFPLGTTTVTWTATDMDGNVGVAFQNVTVIEKPLIKEANQNNKRIMINFDDGYASVFDLGVQILDKYDVKTTQYITCGTPEQSKPGYMTWDEIRSMYAFGHDIQSHSMSHLNANALSQEQLDAEYGQGVIDCFATNGITGVNTVSFPNSKGWNNSTVINTIDDTYEFARGGSTNDVFHIQCNNGSAKDQENCKTYTSVEQNELNKFNRYNILGWKHDTKFREEGFDEAAMLYRFIDFVNLSNKNTESETLQIPIVVYHRVVLDNSDPDPKFQGVTATLLDAEMKYLVDNDFEIYTTKDFGYDETKDWMTITPHE